MDFEALSLSGDGRPEPFIRPLRLTIRARDLGMPSLSSDVALIVYFKDANDNSPSFEMAVYKKNVPEDLPGGTSVLQVGVFIVFYENLYKFYNDL